MGEARDPERTRAAIFAAALQEFAALGRAGARVAAIAAAAGVNKRMIYHYFGSKDGLHAALLAERPAWVASGVYRQEDTLGSQLASAYTEALAAPDWMRLAAWEALTGGTTSTAADRSAWSDALAAIERARQNGEIDADLPAGQLLLALLAVVMFPLAFPQLTRSITGELPDAPTFVAAWLPFLKTLGAKLTPPAPKPRYRLTATLRPSP